MTVFSSNMRAIRRLKVKAKAAASRFNKDDKNFTSPSCQNLDQFQPLPSQYKDSFAPSPQHTGGSAGSNNVSRIRSNGTQASNRSYSRSKAAKLPVEVLTAIFSFLCPHAQDESYGSNEDSAQEDACMLCDMRNLAKASAVCQRWNTAAYPILYRGIRIDTVHFCSLEAVLAEQRKRRSRWSGCEDPMAIPVERLNLLIRTLRENDAIAANIRSIKMPYMTRESCKTELAKLVYLTPNLRYIDLPTSVYQDDSSHTDLRGILYERCPELRKMCWMHGSERTFGSSTRERFPWRELEEVELCELKLGSEQMAMILSSFTQLKAVYLKRMPWLTDGFFDNLNLPFLERIEMEDCPGVTIAGLTNYFTASDRPTLKTLSISKGTIDFAALPFLLEVTPTLRNLRISTYVSAPLPRNTPQFIHTHLRNLKFDIQPPNTEESFSDPCASYYIHLAKSLSSGSLPSLRTLHVTDDIFTTRFPDPPLQKTHPPLTLTIESLHDFSCQKWLYDRVAGGFALVRGSRKGGFVTSAAEEWGRVDDTAATNGRIVRGQRGNNGLLSVGWQSNEERKSRKGDGWWGS